MKQIGGRGGGQDFIEVVTAVVVSRSVGSIPINQYNPDTFHILVIMNIWVISKVGTGGQEPPSLENHKGL